MKIKSPYFKSIIGAAGLMVATSGIIAASDGGSKKVVSIALNAGETYVIKNLGEDNTPAVHVLKNPNALIVHSDAPGELVLLGAAAGQWSLDVKDASGEPITYKIDVKAIASADRLVPGKAPAALSDATGDTKAHEPVVVSSLDVGSGPVDTASKGAAGKVASSAAAPPSGVVAPSAPSVDVAKNTAPTVATDASSASEGAAAGARAATMPVSAPAMAAPAAPIRLAAYMPPTKASDAAPAADAVVPSQAAAAAMAQLPPQKFSSDPLTDPASPDVDRPNGSNFLPADVVELMAGSSQVFDFAHRIRRISVADTEVADIQVINPYQINLIGHKEGFTTLAIWDNQGHYVERQIRIDQFGKQQVMLNVIVAELNRSRLEGNSINWSAALPLQGFSLAGIGQGGAATPYSANTSLGSSAVFGVGTANQTVVSSTAQGTLPGAGLLAPLLLSPNLNYGVAYNNSIGGQPFDSQVFMEFLESHSLAKILAEPHMLANSGEKAEFLSGGEIPIVVAQALNTSIVFKQFGTSVIFVPTVVGRNDIEMEVKPEVSEPDYAHGVSMFGFTVPAFVTRRAQTFVRLKSNQTLIIAGLILHTKTSGVDKTPYLGDLPIVGNLFKHTSYNDVNTDLVMSVTPQIVRSLPDDGRVAQPTDRGPLGEGEIRTERLAQPDVSRPRF